MKVRWRYTRARCPRDCTHRAGSAATGGAGPITPTRLVQRPPSPATPTNSPSPRAATRRRATARGPIGRGLGAFGHSDVLVTNGGAAAVGPIAMQTDEQLRAQFGTHVVGPLALTREALPTLRASRGHVFMLGSGVA